MAGENPAGTERNITSLARILKKAPAGTIYCEDPYLAMRGKLRIEAEVLAAYLASCGVLALESLDDEPTDEVSGVSGQS